jgi:hypothetical protein
MAKPVDVDYVSRNILRKTRAVLPNPKQQLWVVRGLEQPLTQKRTGSLKRVFIPGSRGLDAGPDSQSLHHRSAAVQTSINIIRQ